MMRSIIVLSLFASLAGCAPSIPGTGTLPAAPASTVLLAPGAARAALLYAGGPNTNDVDAYPAFKNNPQPLRHIVTGLDAPTGMAVDGAGDLYVCNNAGQTVQGRRAPGKSVFWTVTVYGHGGKHPIRTYTDGVSSPVDVAIGDGTVYIANYSSAVTVYPPGSVQPSQTLLGPSGYAPLGVALGGSKNVFVSYVSNLSSGGHIYKYERGHTQGRDLGIVFSASPHGIAIDNRGNLIVAVSNAPNPGSDIEIYAPGAKHPKKMLTGPFQPFMVALSADNSRLFVADYGSGNNDGAVFVYAYPSGKLLYKDTNGAAAGAYGVAVSL